MCTVLQILTSGHFLFLVAARFVTGVLQILTSDNMNVNDIILICFIVFVIINRLMFDFQLSLFYIHIIIHNKYYYHYYSLNSETSMLVSTLRPACCHP